MLIDGRSGAGKSTLARLVAQRWPGEVQTLALDRVYPGWDGMDAGVELVRAQVLVPYARGRGGRWQRWDWDAQRAAETHEVSPTGALIVEGAGLLTPATAQYADLTVWVGSPEPSRRRRALDRDGDAYRPHWERWARQEEHHLVRDAPDRLAQIVVTVP